MMISNRKKSKSKGGGAEGEKGKERERSEKKEKERERERAWMRFHNGFAEFCLPTPRAQISQQVDARAEPLQGCFFPVLSGAGIDR